MAAIKGSHTKPELAVRRALHAAGFRFRLHAKNLPGKPDLVFPRYKAVLFVNGCFWHQHDCHLFKWPTTRADFWRAKIGSNRTRDQHAIEALRLQGWRVGVIWECALKGRARLDLPEAMQLIISWIESDSETITIRGR